MVTIIEPYGENIMSEFLEQMEHIVDATIPDRGELIHKEHPKRTMLCLSCAIFW